MTSKQTEPRLPGPDNPFARVISTRRQLPGWLTPAFAATLLVPVVIVLSFRAIAGRRSGPPAWPGTPGHPLSVTPTVLVGAAVSAAALVAAWLWLHRRADAHLRLRVAVPLAALWTGLLAIGPPLLSNDVYSYAAVGRLTVADLDPYVVGPAALHSGPFLAAVDPLWRHTPTPYGPLLVQLFHTAAWATGGSLVDTVLLLRLATVVATAAAVALAVWAARPADRVAVLLLTGLNPVLLLHLVAGTHPDALIGAAAIGVVLLTMSGRWAPAMVVAVLATLVKAPALALVGFVLLYAVRRSAPGHRLRACARGAGIAAAVSAAAWLLLPDAFGWAQTLSVPAEITNPRVPSVWLAWLIRSLFDTSSIGVSWHTATVISRSVTLLVGAGVGLRLLIRATSRTDRWDALRDVGWALIVVALASPIVYGWYLAWGVFAAAAGSRPRDRWALVLVSAGCFVVTAPAMNIVPPSVQWTLWAVAALVWWLAAGRPLPPRRPTPAAPAG